MPPIRPENRHRYGPDWAEFSRSIRFGRAQSRCECEGECRRGTHYDREHHAHTRAATRRADLEAAGQDVLAL